ncbi:hypothetical protein F5Y17DRAFT_84327 [Xylariaceae sp. FL0594]|nr:hypothetical protein F5Y17DRAFT_84327 [Xylariaceae sp. FL0594]
MSWGLVWASPWLAFPSPISQLAQLPCPVPVTWRDGNIKTSQQKLAGLLVHIPRQLSMGVADRVVKTRRSAAATSRKYRPALREVWVASDGSSTKLRIRTNHTGVNPLAQSDHYLPNTL